MAFCYQPFSFRCRRKNSGKWQSMAADTLQKTGMIGKLVVDDRNVTDDCHNHRRYLHRLNAMLVNIASILNAFKMLYI